jgi:hypothetical protein
MIAASLHPGYGSRCDDLARPIHIRHRERREAIHLLAPSLLVDCFAALGK